MTFDVGAYLRRIGYDGPRAPAAPTLAALHTAHLRTVPFENLDVYFRRGVGLDVVKNYDKIVHRGRGGWCFELNGLFAALLTELGFDVTLLSMRVANLGVLGPDLDHLALLVQLDRPWLADVGFGDSTLLPLAVDDAGVQDGVVRPYRVKVAGDRLSLHEQVDGQWSLVYGGTSMPRRIEEFGPRCEWLQSSPESHFTQKPFCTKATSDGRVTLLRNRLKITADGVTREEPVAEDAWAATLEDVFGIRL